MPLPFRHRACLCLLAILGLAISAEHHAPAATQVDLPEGIFFEAEDYDQVLRGVGFAVKTSEPAASAQAVLTGVFRPGAARYQITVPAEGEYTFWLRLMSLGNTRVKIVVIPRLEIHGMVVFTP